jgi:SpoVK/Ycf46/Vps4 family AAA+-type ATPase
VAPWQIRKAVTLSYYQGYPKHFFDQPKNGPNPVVVSTSLLSEAARGQVSKSIGTLAIVSEPKLALDDLIVDEHTLAGIEEIIGAVRHRHQVLTQWRVGSRIQSGTGIVALFDGDPGTGKTHSAGVLAGVLGLSLVRVNIAGVVDKYIGETEKNLSRIFERVRPDISLLLFDEADSMFTKRVSDVTRSTDRYSNMNVNALLQLVEHYEGITILTTNLKRAIDPAFERRFTFKLHFGLPATQQRRRLWEYLLPSNLPHLGDVDYGKLAELELSGGEIKNAILLGCYQAARDGELVNTEHLFNAGVREATATGRVVRYETT